MRVVENDQGGLSSHTGEGDEVVETSGNSASMLGDQGATETGEVPGLRAPQSDATDNPPDPRGGRAGERGGGGNDAKERREDAIDGLVGALGREKDGDEELVGGPCPEFGPDLSVGGVLPSEDAKDSSKVRLFVGDIHEGIVRSLASAIQRAYNVGMGLEGLAPAKINLRLRVLGRRPNGFHDLEMVNATLDLADTVRIEPADRLETQTDLPDGPRGPANLAHRAAFAFAARAGVPPRWRIEITKRIPIGAGLGGGSSDAAAVLRLLNESHGRPSSANEILELAEALGADCPYLVHGVPALVEGIGERVTPIPLAREIPIVVLHPGIPVSTKTVFEGWSPSGGAAGEGTAALRAAMQSGDLPGIAANLANDLTPPAIRVCAEIGRLLGRIQASGSLGASMTGSGSAVFGIFATSEAAARAARVLAQDAPFVHAGRILPSSPERPA